MRLVTALAIAAVFSGAALVSFWPAGDHAGEVTITNPQPGDVELVKAAMQVFAANCPDLFGRFRGDIKKITATVDRNIQWGSWRRMVSVDVRLTSDAESMPASWHAGGTTLSYGLAAGEDPGILTGYGTTQLACGMPAGDDSASAFKSVPEMALIDAMR